MVPFASEKKRLFVLIYKMRTIIRPIQQIATRTSCVNSTQVYKWQKVINGTERTKCYCKQSS